MISFEHSISIEQPLRGVFAFLSDFENIPKWNYYVLSVNKISDGAVGVGTTYRQVRRNDKQVFQITGFVLDTMVAVKTLPKSPLQFERRFTLQARGSTTQIVDTWDALDTGKPRFIERLAAGKIRAAVAENLGKLKTLMETGRVTLQDGRTVRL